MRVVISVLGTSPTVFTGPFFFRSRDMSVWLIESLRWNLGVYNLWSAEEFPPGAPTNRVTQLGRESLVQDPIIDIIRNSNNILNTCLQINCDKLV